MRGVFGMLAALCAVLALVAYLLGPPESAPKNQKVAQPVEVQKSSDGVLDVSLELEEGDFDILPARAGKAIEVEADYDEAQYRLTPTYSADSGRSPRFRCVFEHRGRMRQLRSLVHGQRSSKGNRVRIQLPTGVPMELQVHVRRGEAVLDLSGLSLRALEIDHAMGDTELRFNEPNPVEMERLEIQSRMGELIASGLGDAAARDVKVEGLMGDLRLDFDGKWRADTRASLEITMGDARLSVPPEVGLELTGRKVLLGALRTDRDTQTADPERAKDTRVLHLHTRVNLGDLQVR